MKKKLLALLLIAALAISCFSAFADDELTVANKGTLAENTAVTTLANEAAYYSFAAASDGKYTFTVAENAFVGIALSEEDAANLVMTSSGVGSLTAELAAGTTYFIVTGDNTRAEAAYLLTVTAPAEPEEVYDEDAITPEILPTTVTFPAYIFSNFEFGDVAKGDCTFEMYHVSEGELLQASVDDYSEASFPVSSADLVGTFHNGSDGIINFTYTFTDQDCSETYREYTGYFVFKMVSSDNEAAKLDEYIYVITYSAYTDYTSGNSFNINIRNLYGYAYANQSDFERNNYDFTFAPSNDADSNYEEGFYFVELANTEYLYAVASVTVDGNTPKASQKFNFELREISRSAPRYNVENVTHGTPTGLDVATGTNDGSSVIIAYDPVPTNTEAQIFVLKQTGSNGNYKLDKTQYVLLSANYPDSTHAATEWFKITGDASKVISKLKDIENIIIENNKVYHISRDYPDGRMALDLEYISEMPTFNNKTVPNSTGRYEIPKTSVQ